MISTLTYSHGTSDRGQKTLLNDYLNDMHKAQHEVNITMPWAPHLKLGQTLVVDQQIVSHLRYTPVRILRISHDFDTRKTHITARTFTREMAAPKPITFIKKPDDQTFVINEQITPVQLPKARGEIIPITYTLYDSNRAPRAVTSLPDWHNLHRQQMRTHRHTEPTWHNDDDLHSERCRNTPTDSNHPLPHHHRQSDNL